MMKITYKLSYFAIVLLTFLFQKEGIAQEIPVDDKVVIINEQTINSDKLELCPAFYKDGIVFISTNNVGTKKKKDKNLKADATSLLVSRRGPESFLTKPEIFSTELTSEYNDGPITFDRGQEMIYFSTNYTEKAKDGQRKQKICSAMQKDGKWGDVKVLNFNSIESDAVHPSISIDGTRLYFASNRPDGYGGLDIYVCTKTGEDWGEPVNLGSKVNTDKNDYFPFIHADGTLYFASNGRGGAGGMDIFYAKPDPKTKFSTPKNLGRPFNSENDDFGLIVDLESKNGYFTSNRTGGKGQDDIYGFSTSGVIGKDEEIVTKKDKKVVMYVVDKLNSNEVGGAEVKFMNISGLSIGDIVTDNNGNIISLSTKDSVDVLKLANSNKTSMQITDKEGKTEINVTEGDYLLSINKPGYQPKQVMFTATDERDEMLVLLEKVKAEEGIPMVCTLKNNRGTPIPGATVTLKNEDTGETQIITSDENGKLKYYVKPKTNYSINATKNNYVSGKTKFNTKDIADNKQELPIAIKMEEVESPLAEGKVFELKNVYYNYNDASLRNDARQDLDILVNIMNAYPELEIELSSHTDSRGTSVYNQTLSQNRAKSAATYLVEHGINANRIKAVGYGESRLRNKCADGVTCSEAEHKINRRTEVRITKGASNANIVVKDDYPTSLESDFNAAPITNTTTSNNGNTNQNTDTFIENNGKKTKPTKTTKTNDSVVVTDGSSVENANPTPQTSGEYWVVAGSFESGANAEKQLSDLKRKNVEGVEITFATDIKFYRVVTLKTNSLADAKSQVRMLKSKGFPSFIKN